MNMLRRGAALFSAEKTDILGRLRTASAVASDETGVRIEGLNAYQWVFLSTNAVVHEVAFSRAARVIDTVMGDHRPQFWLSDRYSAQQNRADRHQTCLAHLARDIVRINQTGDAMIGLRLKLWIDDVFNLARRHGDLAASTLRRKRRDLDNRIGDIVCTPTDCEETGAVLRKIANARDQLFTFVDAPEMIEPTNNGCERALRPSVINRKVTNGFRSMWAAELDTAIRTVVDTARLAGINPYAKINQILSA